MLSEQLSFNFVGESHSPNSKAVSSAVEKLSMEASSKSRGAIFTRQEVVDFILDLLGYTSDQALYTKQLLEPAFGAGDFLLPIVKRLLASWRAANTRRPTADDLSQAIRAVELHRPTYNRTYEALIFLLTTEGLTPSAATTLANQWLLQGDFLLIPLAETFDFVVGNPPYIRQELIPEPLLAEYRNRYNTLYDRADIYVPFIERSLYLLAPQGNVGFICANRWTKNRYGGPLRALIDQHFHLKIYIDMEDFPAFTSKVVAYPSITIISQGKSDITRISPSPSSADPTSLNGLSAILLAKALPQNSGGVRELSQVTNGSDPWLLKPSEQTALIRRLEQQFPGLEAAGCKVGIGVATGADKIFIADFESLDVEPQCKLPLATTKDIVNGDVQWLGKGVINPFDSTGSLVDLEQYPRLRAYLERHRDIIANRHCAKKSPNNWYRTIDRITPALAARPKLLIPDIKGNANIVFEPGEFYPHHNLYYVLSDEWDLRALQAVLLSAIAHLFIATYSTKMRGGFLRFQAQYLRRIHIPRWRDVPPHLRQELADAAIRRDLDACDHAVADLYGLSHLEQAVLQGVRA